MNNKNSMKLQPRWSLLVVLHFVDDQDDLKESVYNLLQEGKNNNSVKCIYSFKISVYFKVLPCIKSHELFRHFCRILNIMMNHL